MSENKKEYSFGGIEEFTLEEIENEILMDATYLDIFAGCDLRLKENVTSYQGKDALTALCSLNTIEFNYTAEAQQKKSQPAKRQVGVVAQELAQVLPSAVAKDSDGYLYVNYKELVPLLISSIQELKSQIDQQHELIEKLLKK